MQKVDFFSDGSEKSNKARQMLTDSGLPFDEFVEDKDWTSDREDPIIPPTVFGVYGQFMGIKAVERYISLWKADPTEK